MAGLVDADDTTADGGQLISQTENTMSGPSSPTMTDVTVVHEGSEANDDEDTKDNGASQRKFTRPQAPQKGLLLTIAPEIRNMIYKLCLTHPEDIGEKLKLKKKVECFTVASHYPNHTARPKLEEAYELSMSKVTHKSIRQHSLRNLALMRTCQAMYNDAARVFWGQRFTFRNTLQLQNFLLTPHLRHDLVRDVKVLKMDYNIGVNYMPGVSVLMADKLKALEVFEIDMGHMRRDCFIIGVSNVRGFQDDDHIEKAAKNLGFGIYSCMHPWVTEVVRKQGIDKLMSILQIVREEDPIGPYGEIGGNPRVYWDFKGRGPLTANQRVMADIVTGKEILRQFNIYEQQL